MITFSTKIAELIHADVYALSILQRLNIPLGVGDKTIHEVCVENKVHPELFLYLTKLFLYGELPTDFTGNKELLPHLIGYLKLTHLYYLDNRLPLIEKFIGQILNNEPERADDIQLLLKFFHKYRNEFLTHLENEEKNVFPYVMLLYVFHLKKQCDKEMHTRIRHNPIIDFEKEHDNLNEKLNDLKNIIIKYLNPFRSEYEVHQILILLSQLEKDVFQHAQLEDLLMVPSVLELEKEILSYYNE